MSTDQTKYRIYCNTESLWVTGYSLSEPTACYNNIAHTPNLNSVEILQSGSSTLNQGVYTVTSTVASTSVGTGALIVSAGGFSVFGSSYLTKTFITSTINSTSSSTGALILTGGLGVGLNSFFGGTVGITNATTSTTPTTGALVVTGGVGISGPTFLGNTFSTTGFATFSGGISSVLTTNSTSTSTGCLTLSGGLGIVKDAFFGGLLNLTGVATITNATASTSNSTGALIVSGGVGIGGSLYSGALTVTGASQNNLNINCQGSTTVPGQIIFTNSAGTGDYRITSDGGDLCWQGGGSRAMQFGAYHEVYIVGGRNTTTPPTMVAGSNAAYNCVVLNLNDSIALRVVGSASQTANLEQWENSSNTVLASVSSSGAFSMSQPLTITNNTQSTSYTTGSTIISGGVGIAGNLYVNGSIFSNSQVSDYTVKTANYTALTTNSNILCNTASGGFTITLPANSGNSGLTYTIAKVSNDQNIITISANGAETIGGSSSNFTLTNAWSHVRVIASGSTTWYISSFTSNPINNVTNTTATNPYGGQYGTGAAGNVTISVNTSLTANTYYDNLTINSGIVLNPAGFLVVVRNTLTFVSGTSAISTNGSNAVVNVLGVAGGTYCDLIAGGYSTFIGGGRPGVNGVTATNNGTNSTSYTTNNVSPSGSGGNGGGSSGNTGGTAGTVTAISIQEGGNAIFDLFPHARGRGTQSNNNIVYNGGTGGASGALTAGSGLTLKSGAGGGGGGVVIIYARQIVATSGGIISANGGNGGNATAGTLNNASIGGGGGGGGGLISIITSTPWATLSLTTTVNGSSGGTGLGTNGATGSSGNAGRITINQV